MPTKKKDQINEDNSDMLTAEPEHTKEDKSEKRSFQTGSDPGQRENLTKAQAEKKGLFWRED